VHHDGSLCEIEANVNLVVQLKDVLEAPYTTFSNSDGNLSLEGLYRGHSNMQCASFSIAL
jgi:hypothetical protein